MLVFLAPNFDAPNFELVGLRVLVLVGCFKDDDEIVRGVFEGWTLVELSELTEETVVRLEDDLPKIGGVDGLILFVEGVDLEGLSQLLKKSSSSIMLLWLLSLIWDGCWLGWETTTLPGCLQINVRWL